MQARKHAKLTQVQAAKGVQMAQGTLAQLEIGGKGSSYTVQLAELYGVSANWLASNKGKMISGGGGTPRSMTAQKLVSPKKNNDLENVIKLLTLFISATAQDKQHIMDAAEQIKHLRGDASNDETT